MEFNLIITSFRGEQRELLRALSGLGSFKRTSFRDVITGQVDDVFKLMDELEQELPLSLSRVVILNELFGFKTIEELIEQLKAKVLDYIELIIKHKTFRVTVERRGLKGELNSHELEKELGSILFEHLRAPKVDLTDPEVELVIEVMDNKCGIGFITKELRDKYPFIKT